LLFQSCYNLKPNSEIAILDGTGSENPFSTWQTFGRFADNIEQAVLGKIPIGRSWHNPTDKYFGRQSRKLDTLNISFKDIRQNPIVLLYRH